MHTLCSDERVDYDGSQLRAHWLLSRFGLCGDAAVAFRGACAVAVAEMADLADIDGPGIAANDMLHVVWESFAAPDLLLAVHRQRLLAAQACEVLAQLAPNVRLRRDGDDLWLDRGTDSGKLSISIATVTPVSSLIHFAVNATPGGAPVPTATLQELGVEPRDFAERLLARAAGEQASISGARAKVRAKGEWR